jgi:hypothetical protein
VMLGFFHRPWIVEEVIGLGKDHGIAPTTHAHITGNIKRARRTATAHDVSAHSAVVPGRQAHKTPISMKESKEKGVR